MQRPSVEKVIAVMRAKNYRIYDTAEVDWNLNIVGVRNKSLRPKKFDDLLIVFHRFLGSWDVSYYPITTDPSLYYLRSPIKPYGTAVLVEGQYEAAYKIDIHNRGRRGGHKALCQRLADVSVYRDNTKDELLDLTPDSIQEGMFGINIHRGPRNGEANPDNSFFSAGCQVFADDRHFAEFMLKCESGRAAFGNTFTYTLLSETDFT